MYFIFNFVTIEVEVNIVAGLVRIVVRVAVAHVAALAIVVDE